MGTLYIDRKDLHIKLDGQAIAFYSKEGREGVVPINPLKRVVMVGNILIETSVLNRLSSEGISVLFLSGKRLRFCGILHGKLHNNGILRVKQYEKSLSSFGKEVAVDIVKRKVSGQRDFLMHIRENRSDLRFPMTNAVCSLQGIILEIEKIPPESPHTPLWKRDNPPKSPFNKGGLEGDFNGGMGGFLETLRGLEGGASATYFSAYTTMFPESLGFNKRTKRPPEDPVNAMLSLCYTLLHFEMVREVEVIGLDPVIGFYHQFDYGRESLACDLVEPYRPLVDRFVWELFRDRVFTNRDFAFDDERPGCYLKKGGRQRFYQLYEEWAQKMRPLWTEEARGIARRITNGQDTVY